MTKTDCVGKLNLIIMQPLCENKNADVTKQNKNHNLNINIKTSSISRITKWVLKIDEI